MPLLVWGNRAIFAWLKPISHRRILRNISLNKTLWSTNSPWPWFFSFKDSQFSEDKLFLWQRGKILYVFVSWACWTKLTSRNLAFFLSVTLYKNMAVSSEASTNEVNLVAWSLETEVLFTQQVRYREFLWNMKSSLYLRKNTQYAM